MTKYRLKTKKSGKNNGALKEVYEEIESGVADSNRAIGNAVVDTYKSIENGTVGAYKAIENGVVGTYNKIENGVVNTYKKIEKKFGDKFLEKVPEEE